MTEGPVDIREHGVTDYDQVGDDRDFPPFRFKLGGELREVAYPLASTKRDAQTAIAENRVNDFYRLVFGAQWPDVSQALDDLGARGDDAQTQLTVDLLDHIGMNEESIERYRANRAERRAERKARGAAARRGGR